MEKTIHYGASCFVDLILAKHYLCEKSNENEIGEAVKNTVEKEMNRGI